MMTKQQINKMAHIKYGNQLGARGKPLKIIYWNKGSSHLFRKMPDVMKIVEQHQPHILALAEANVLQHHDLSELKIPDYTLHLASSISDPTLAVARMAVYTHKTITVKRQPDLEDADLQLICLEAGLPRQKKSLYLMGYRQWQLPSQQDASSGTLAAQAERWDRILGRWEAALLEGKEVITAMDANLDAMTWRHDMQTLPRHSTSLTHSALIDSLFERIIPQGVEMMTPTVPTWARGDQRSCLDHIYSNAPGKLSPVAVTWNGMSDHAMISFTRYTRSLHNRVAYVRKRSFKSFNPVNFKTSVAAMPELDAIKECREVNRAAAMLTAGLTKILDRTAPIKTIQTRRNYAPHLGEATKELQDQRNAAQKQAVGSSKQEDWRKYRSLRNQATASARRDLASWTSSKLCSKANSQSDVWSAVKRILNWEGGGPPSQLFYEGRMLTKPAAVASAINTFFVKKVKSIIAGIPRVDMDPLAKLRERMAARQCSLTLRPVTEAEVLKQIQGIKSTPATGVDFID